MALTALPITTQRTHFASSIFQQDLVDAQSFLAMHATALHEHGAALGAALWSIGAAVLLPAIA